MKARDRITNLSKTFMLEGFKSRSSNVDEKLLAKLILEDSKLLSKQNKVILENYFCHPIRPHKHFDWILKHSVGSYIRFEKENLIPMRPVEACVLNKKFYSIRRNHLHQFNSYLSPDAVLIYFLQGEGSIHYDYYHYKKDHNRWVNSYFPGKFYIISSDINYFLKNNTDTVYVTYACRRVS